MIDFLQRKSHISQPHFGAVDVAFFCERILQRTIVPSAC